MKKYLVYSNDVKCIAYLTKSSEDNVKAYVKHLNETEFVKHDVLYKEVNDEYIPPHNNYKDDLGIIIEMCK